MRKGKDRYYQAEGGYEENGDSVNMRGIHGDYKIDKVTLADICHLDNRHPKEGETNHPDMIMSSEMIITKYGGQEGIMKALYTDPNMGIQGTAEDIKDRHRIYGTNMFPPPYLKSIYELIMENFEDRINQILLGAAIVSIAIGLYREGSIYGLIEGTSICIALVIIVSVTSVNNYYSEKRLADLLALSEKQEIAVFRNSDKPTMIDSDDLVVGDIFVFQQGDKMPADAIMIEGQDVIIEDSELTGESESFPKVPVTLQNYKDGACCTLLAKSLVQTGVGKAVAIAVGYQTVSGIISLKAEPDQEQTLLMKKLDVMAGKIGNLGFGAAIGTFIASLIRILLETFGALPCGCQNMFSCQQPIEGTCETYNFGSIDNQVYPMLLEAVIISITVVVVAIPEGLPLAVTISLSFASAKMEKLQNLVRKLASAETMGGATHICSDKTGTLTKNEMTVMATMAMETVIIGDKGAEGRDIITPSKNTFEGQTNNGQTIWDLMLEGIVWNSSATIHPNDGQDSSITSEFVLKGNQTEQGIFKFFMNALSGQYLINKIDELTKELVLAKITFTSKRKMGTIAFLQPNVSEDREVRVQTKGAPDFLLENCKYCIGLDGTIKDIDTQTFVPQHLLENEEMEGVKDTYKGLYQRTIRKFAKQAYRTLLVAYNDMSRSSFNHMKTQNNDFANEEDRAVLEQDLTAVGIFGLQDPLRDSVYDSIKTCSSAGITVIMCTGDNLDTAKAISLNAGIVTQNEVDSSPYACMTGKDFREAVGGLITVEVGDKKVDAVQNMPKFKEIIAKLKVLARSSPSDKYLLVTGVQDNDGVVAVTGDGTNDAPALTKADVGFAMGTGTGVARGASDIILLDDNFSSIIVALTYGRNVYDNVRKFLQFQLTVNYVAMFIVFLGAVVTKKSPLNAVQMLWVNLIMDTFAALALATEPPPADILMRMPYAKNNAIITQYMSRNVQGHAIYQVIVLLVFLFAGPDLLIDHQFESQCAIYDEAGFCDTKHLNPFYTETAYYDPAIWTNFIKEQSSGYDDDLGTLKDEYQFDPQLLYTWRCNMFGQEHMEYAESLEYMKLCQLDYEDLPSQSFDDSYYQQILDDFKASAWLNVLPSTEKLEFQGEEYTSRGKMTELTKLFSLVFNAFVFMQIFNQLNARLLEEGEFNVFAGICKNPMFLIIVLITIVVQMLMVEFGGRMVKCWPLTWSQNLLCLLIGLGELPWGLLIKFIPHKVFFLKISLEDKENDGEQKVYISTALKSKGKKKKNETGDDKGTAIN